MRTRRIFSGPVMDALPCNSYVHGPSHHPAAGCSDSQDSRGGQNLSKVYYWLSVQKHTYSDITDLLPCHSSQKYMALTQMVLEAQKVAEQALDSAF